MIRREDDDDDDEQKDWNILAKYHLPDGAEINVLLYWGYWVDGRGIGSDNEKQRMSEVVYDLIRRFQKEADSYGQYMEQRK